MSEPDNRRWHVWYDDYERGTVFITAGEDGPNGDIIDQGVPYQEGVDMVFRHNTELMGGTVLDDKKET